MYQPEGQPYQQPTPPAGGSRWLSMLFSALMVGVLAFGGGWWLGHRQGVNDARIVPQSAAVDNNTGAQQIEPAELNDQFELYWEVWDLVQEEFYHEEPIDQKELVYGSIRGLLQSLDDPYTFFEEPEEAEHTRESMGGSFEGIGAYIEFLDGEITIVSPIEGSPAERAGLKAGDQIIAVNGELLSEKLSAFEPGQAASEGAKLIRGPKGTTVHLTIHRPSANETFELDIVRDSIPLITVRSQMLGDIGYVQITQFSATTPAELDKELKELKANNPRALVLDLRNNPGGLVDTSQEVLGRFVEEGAMMYQRYNDGTEKMIPLKREKGDPQTFFDIPTVVLVNGGSASASEIIAGAFRDYERGELLGATTFGKGSVQNVHPLSDGSNARITIARWLTPDKHQIHDVGITPNYIVGDSTDATQFPVDCIGTRQPEEGQTSCGDEQLFWALKLLRGEGTPPPPTPTPDPATAPTATPER